jgi:hypothetical protein
VCLSIHFMFQLFPLPIRQPISPHTCCRRRHRHRRRRRRKHRRRPPPPGSARRVECKINETRGAAMLGDM